MHCKPSLQNSCHQKVSEKKSSRNIERRFGNDAEGHYYWSQKWPPIFFIFNFAQYSVPRIPSRHSYFCQMSKLCQRNEIFAKCNNRRAVSYTVWQIELLNHESWCAVRTPKQSPRPPIWVMMGKAAGHGMPVPEYRCLILS